MIELKQVSAGYNRKAVIKNINMTFEKGKITSIIGKNGSGKTTLIKAASGRLKPECGEIILEDRDIYDYGSKELAKKISYLPQVRDIPEVSVQNLVLYGRFPYLTFPRNPSVTDRTITENAMKDAGIWDYRNRNVCELSGGERQKVYIAMILSQNTDFIFFDEPTTYLDINHQLEILRLIGSLKQAGKTIIMVMHDISAALCNSDRICLMDMGEIAAYGCPQTIFESKEIERVFNVRCEQVSSVRDSRNTSNIPNTSNANLIKGYLFYNKL